MATDKSDYQRVFATVFTKAEELLANAGKNDNALRQYLESWLEIAEIAAELNNFVLQDVVLLFIETSNEVFSSLKQMTDEHWELLKKWDICFENYINAPDNHYVANSLIKCLNEPLLDVALSVADKKMLLDGFILVAEQLAKGHPPLKVNSSWNELGLLFNEVIFNFRDIFSQKNTDNVTLYLQNWQKIADFIETKITQKPWDGLLDIVSLFIAINTQAFNQNKYLNSEQQSVLNKWHDLFGNYLKTHGSQQISIALIKCLTHPVWADAISSEDEKMLLENIGILKSPSTENALAIKKTTVENSIKPVKKLNIWKQIEPFSKVASANLKSIIAGDEQALSLFQENWQKIAQTIENNDEHQGLLDVVLLFIEFSLSTFEQAITLNDKQIIVLNKWHNLFASYLQARGNRTLAMSLVKCLGDTAWSDAITLEDEKMLLKGFDEKSKATFQQLQPSPIEPTSNIVEHKSKTIPQIHEPKAKVVSIWQNLEQQLKKSAQHLKATIDQQIIGNQEVFSENLQLYNQDWQQIIAIMEKDSQQLDALIDVVLLFNELTRSTFETQNDVTAEQLGLLNKWQRLFSQYLENKDNPQIIKSLIGCLENPVWSEAILAEDTALLLAAFSISSEQERKKPELAELSSTTAVETEIKEEASLQILELKEVNIWEEIRTIFDKTAGELKSIIDFQIDNDSQGLNRSLQVYIQYWQQIADILEENNQQLGLMDVVLLFTEVSIPAFEELNSRQLALLNQWHHLFDDYLTAQGHKEIAESLINCLTDSAWPKALSEKDGKMLLEGFVTADDNRLTIVDLDQKLISSADIIEEYHPIWDKIKSFFNDSLAHTNNLVNVVSTDTLQNSTNSLQQYANYWSLIADIIKDKNELQVLIDISLLFADNCLELSEQQSSLNNDFIQLLQQWHSAFKLYLQDITELQSLVSLLNILENELWVRPLTTEDREMLLELMIAENDELIFADDSSEDLLIFNDELFVNEQNKPLKLSTDNSITKKETSVELFAEKNVDENNNSLELFNDEPVSEEFNNVAEEDEALKLFSDDDVVEEDETLELFSDDDVVEEDETLELFSDDDVAEGAETEKEIESFEIVATDKKSKIVAEVEKTVTIEPTHVNPELIGMVKDEFVILIKDLAPIPNDISDIEVFKETLKEHHFKFENLAKACNTIGLLGLEKVFEQLSINMRSRRASDSSFSETERILFKDSLPLIQNYIIAINNKDRALRLVEHLQQKGWKQPFDEDQAESLTTLLSNLIVNSNEEQLENRKTTAEVSDVSLQLPEDVNQELLNSLLNELPVLTANFSAIIQKIISRHRSVDQLLEAQRIAHTLKGSGNIVGIVGIAVLTHHLEEILEYLTEKQRFPTKALARSLLEAADCLEMMSEIILSGEYHAPEQAIQVLQTILDWANKIASKGLPEDDNTTEEQSTLSAITETDTHAVIQSAKAAESIAMTHVPSELVDDLLRMTGEGSILSEQFKERVNRFSDEIKHLHELTWQMQTLVSELDQSINIQSYAGKGTTGNSEFDALEMEQYNELHTATSRLAEVATDIREVNIGIDEQIVDLKYLMIDEEAVQKENQEMVQSIRMIPASTIASRCQRIVRQACRMTNKEVELEIKGGNILIDSEILNDMVDPLMHLLRNSVDHGIEPKHIRQKKNKSEIGNIVLEFSRKGNYAVISCKDDGGGLSSGNILQTAIKKGLITANQPLSDAEIHKLILIPGFSTRSVATQVSGRGIGMDAIQTRISALQGQMSLSSVRGEGLTIEITIPLTLSSMLSLLVRCGNQTMAISNRGLQKIHHADDCELVEYNDKKLICQIAGEKYPARYFGELLGMSRTYDETRKLPALRISDEIGKTQIVFVDELLGYRDLLVKDMGCYIPHIQGITGASILGNGDVAPVIDLIEMLHYSTKYNYLLVDTTKGLLDSVSGLPVALVVDDSLSARRAVAMLLEDSGIDVETAIDGLDAIKKIENKLPDILVVDLEMPRMNGIELTAHIRGREDTKETPVIMITSRATEKHRKQAEAAGVSLFMTKPFSEDELMNNVRGMIAS